MQKNQISQVKEFSGFLCIRRCKSLGSLKSFLSYASQLSGASVLSISHSEILSAHLRAWLQPEGCLISQVFSFLNAHRAQIFTFGGLEWLLTLTSLLTDMAGNMPFLGPSSWSEIRPIFGRHFMTNFVPWCWET